MIRALFFVLICFGGLTPPAYGAGPSEERPFLPTWKLLNQEQKQQFIAGYLFGWNDAAQITAIVAGFAKENPEQAQRGLEKLQSLYDVGNLKPGAIAREVDTFYSDPSNSSAGLSRAVSFAKGNLK
jgi:hypothetical protein